MKFLMTSNTDIVKYSQDQFGFKLPSELGLIPNRRLLQNLQNHRLQTVFKSIEILEMCVIY